MKRQFWILILCLGVFPLTSRAETCKKAFRIQGLTPLEYPYQARGYFHSATALVQNDSEQLPTAIYLDYTDTQHLKDVVSPIIQSFYLGKAVNVAYVIEDGTACDNYRGVLTADSVLYVEPLKPQASDL